MPKLWPVRDAGDLAYLRNPISVPDAPGDADHKVTVIKNHVVYVIVVPASPLFAP
jgi:hypothetical protein